MKSLIIIGVFLIFTINLYVAQATSKKNSIGNIGSFFSNHYDDHVLDDKEIQEKVSSTSKVLIVDQKMKNNKLNLMSKKIEVPSIHNGDENGECVTGANPRKSDAIIGVNPRKIDAKDSKQKALHKTELLQMRKVSNEVQKFKETDIPKNEKEDDIFIYEDNNNAVLNEPLLRNRRKAGASLLLRRKGKQ